MKNLFLTLLLANALFLAWQFWVLPPEIDPSTLRAGGRERELPLFTRAPARARVAAPVAARTNDAPVRSDAGREASSGEDCFRVGPFAEAAAAGNARDAMTRNGWQAGESSSEGQVWLGYWVQVENLAERAEAEKIVARLTAGGVPEAYVGPAGPPFSISLGVFRERDRAEKIAATARGMGFSPLISDRYRTGTEHWLTAHLPAGQTLELARLGLDPGQIVRTEPTRCIAPSEPIN